MATHPENNEYENFENDFKQSKEAEAGMGVGAVPDGTYQVVCSKQDLKGDGTQVDHETFEANTGTKGFKIFLEILTPEIMVNKTTGEKVKTKGEVVEYVFWITQKNLSFLKRDVKTILGRELTSLSELKTIVWVGRTCEVGIVNKLNKRGFKQSEVSFINAWSPKAAGAGDGKQAAGAPAGGAPTGQEEEPAF